jgi:4-amino-4-deoxy-L-arabinose transferase-like glycosyltransferase
VLVSLTGGVAHAPGFPLLTMLGRAFAALPIEPAPFRVSLLSALAAAGTTAIVALTARRLGASPSASVVGALAFATAPVVWRWSVVPEAFPLNDLLVAATVGALVAWQTGGRDRWLLLAALAGGSALAHHQTAVLLAPAGLLALWHERTRLRARPRSLAASAVLLLVGFLPYAYVPLAGDGSAPWRWADARTLGDVMDLITRRSYGSAQLSNVASLQGGSPLVRVGLLLGSYAPLEALLVLAGAVMAWRERRWYATEVGVAVLFAGPLFIAYANLDPANAVSRSVLERFFLLPHVLVAPLMPLGIAYLAHLAPRSVVPPGWVVGAAALAVAIAAALAYASVDRREDHVARSYGLDILQSADQGAVLLTAGDDATLAVAYLQAVEGVRPDVTHVAAPLLRGDWYVRQLRARHPDLRLPGERITALGELVEANPARTFAAVGPLTDNSLARTHWLYPKGLTAVLRRLPAGGAIDDLARENDALLARYHPPLLAAVRDRAWERAILGDYAFAAYVVGEQYEAARDIASARTWYRRALSIDPEDAASRRALARIGP